MNKVFLFLAKCCLLSLPFFSTRNDDYKLVWSDEFNGDQAPDSASWRYERGFVRNHEFQWYQTDNARCANGILTIEARKEHKPNPNWEEGSTDWRKKDRYIEYTSSSINTAGKRSWLYGRFEMRARIDTSMGLWPAWWTLGVNRRWPSNGEIDIMEYYRKDLLANIAIGTTVPSKAQWFSNKKPISSFADHADWAQKFHVWRMDWDEKEISLWVDGELLNKQSMGNLSNRDSTHFNPFTQPHYMLLNMAIGGDNGGDPAASPSAFPKKFEVDYVRVYQKSEP
ncbi:MAG: glycoside hydrolase family 16 protein [Williamsia sp.]|nr:glycoside hydrolase family 16 protein [Williamsia sp.]